VLNLLKNKGMSKEVEYLAKHPKVKSLNVKMVKPIEGKKLEKPESI